MTIADRSKWRKETGAKLKALRGDKTLAQFCALYNATPPLSATFTASVLSRIERGLVSCPGEKLDKAMALQARLHNYPLETL